jgi:hypothetical protein
MPMSVTDRRQDRQLGPSEHGLQLLSDRVGQASDVDAPLGVSAQLSGPVSVPRPQILVGERRIDTPSAQAVVEYLPSANVLLVDNVDPFTAGGHRDHQLLLGVQQLDQTLQRGWIGLDGLWRRCTPWADE